MRSTVVVPGALAAVIALTAVVVHFSRGGWRQAPGPAVKSESAGWRTARRSRQVIRSGVTDKAAPDEQELAAVDFDWRRVLTRELMPPQLPREEVEKYLERNRRDAASLLAAYGALHDTNYLSEAAGYFPDNPRVQLSVLGQNLFPEERRQWLDRFKASSPDNPLADYLSARDYFESGQSNLAVGDLLAAAAKPCFQDYSMEFKLDEMELNLFAGRSPIQAELASSAWANDLLPQLTSLKGLSQDVVALQKQYVESGDTASAENLAEAGLTIANGIRSDKALISRLVGNAIEVLLLSQMDPGQNYGFLGGRTPAERIAELRAQRTSIKEATQAFVSALPNLSEAELLNYTERRNSLGEWEAMRWLQQRSSATGAAEFPR